MAFVQHFRGRHPEYPDEQKWERFQGRPLLSGGISLAVKTVGEIPEVQALPEVNRNVVLGMTTRMMECANRMVGEWEDGLRGNAWGLYLVGSRANGTARSDSDVDLLSVGTFYRSLAFGAQYEEEDGLLRGFRIERPDELPDEYNIGDVDRKYLLRAMPKSKATEVLPIDLSVVDLTHVRCGLDDWLERFDVDQSGAQLPRLPLIEVTTPGGY